MKTALNRPDSIAETMRLPFPPSVNALYANVPRKGRVKTDRYSSWLTEAGYAVNRDVRGCVRGPYALHITAKAPDARQRDLGNIEKPISDLLQAMGVIENDSMAQRITLQWSHNPVESGVHVMVISTSEAK